MRYFTELGFLFLSETTGHIIEILFPSKLKDARDMKKSTWGGSDGLHLPLALVMISRSSDQAPPEAPCSAESSSPSPSMCTCTCSLINLKKKFYGFKSYM